MKDIIEIAVAVVIIVIALRIFIKSIKKKGSGTCGCSNCSANCKGRKSPSRGGK
ncbi:MAG TPA: FeoB-associated Cys-rich membrane protein [Clostridiaceae bacterium]